MLGVSPRTLEGIIQGRSVSESVSWRAAQLWHLAGLVEVLSLSEPVEGDLFDTRLVKVVDVEVEPSDSAADDYDSTVGLVAVKPQVGTRAARMARKRRMVKQTAGEGMTIVW
jgi:hypothetical protein